jgi:hypothetical protein
MNELKNEYERVFAVNTKMFRRKRATFQEQSAFFSSILPQNRFKNRFTNVLETFFTSGDESVDDQPPTHHLPSRD